jgi:ABC-type branched-subunit amino acid transport system permease subunit
MGVSDTLSNEVKGIAIMVVIIVVFSIVLLKFKDIEGGTTGLNTSIDTAVSALDEPVSWIVIVVIILVVAWLMKYLKGKDGAL